MFSSTTSSDTLRQVRSRLRSGELYVTHPVVPEPRSLPDARAWVAGAPSAGLTRRLPSVPLVLVLCDVLALGVLTAVVDLPAGLLAFFAVVVLLGRTAMRFYRRRLHLSVLDELPRAVGSALGAAGVLLIAVTLMPTPEAVPTRVVVLVAGHAALSLVLHALALMAVRWYRRGRGTGERTLIIGAGHVGNTLARTLLDHPELGLQPVGFADADSLTAPADLNLPVLTTDLGQLSETLRETRSTTAIMAFSAAAESRIVDAVIAAHQTGCQVLIVPRMFELHHDGPDVERIRGVPVIRLRPDPTLQATWWIKRIVDVLAGLLGLIVLSPILLLVAALILVESGRPVLFWQERVGLDHRLFRLCKFRSMRPADEKESQTNWSIAQDPRVGPVGRFLRRSSIDELPQLWNIARGDMSLVGPRPERPTFVRQFTDQHERYWARHRVPVGLTGLAQVNGLRGDTSIHERARYDNYYIANWSLWLDVKILVSTLREVARGGGR